MSPQIELMDTPCFIESKRTENFTQNTGNTLSDAKSRFQKFRAATAQENRASCGFFGGSHRLINVAFIIRKK